MSRIVKANVKSTQRALVNIESCLFQLDHSYIRETLERTQIPSSESCRKGWKALATRRNTQASPRLPRGTKQASQSSPDGIQDGRQGHAKEFVGLCPPSFCSRVLRTASTASTVSRAGKPRRTDCTPVSFDLICGGVCDLQAIFALDSQDCAVQTRLLRSSQLALTTVTANQESELESRDHESPAL
ncbi:hypothetical protein CONLIGDRAFT_79768 [Coniochaeta ligniaria NRRL 30616]|uniref:Uncharacterized protein n=1 Tax=Coniochaeta ligniaria NRRL 30616 TaxID=1408157 RepID=A0A1J7ICM5_9PEZI|nr:hypothetical protein CONLIGDRAFT_79768 [Coniochaeta ligniaria NRRL 30616]